MKKDWIVYCTCCHKEVNKVDATYEEQVGWLCGNEDCHTQIEWMKKFS